MTYRSLQLVCAVLALLHVSSAQDLDLVGKVFIGQDENDTTTVYSFNENQIGNPIPVYIRSFNETTGEQFPPNERVTVTCEVIDGQQDGFTYATFSSEVIDSNGDSADINIISSSIGRPTHIQCWGESVTGVFAKETSVSSPVWLEIKPAGTANILSPVVSVPNSDNTLETGSFVVQLSEIAQGSNVSISCTEDASNGTLQLDIPGGIIYEGQDRLRMTFTIFDKGDGVASYVCAAASINGDQFITATSAGEGALFVLDQGEVVLVPVQTNLLYPQMTAYLVLDAEPVDEVTYSCNITETDTYEEAQAIQESDVCDITTEVLERPRDPGTFNDSTTALPDTTPPTNASGFWELSSTSIIFLPEGARIGSITITRTNRIQPVTPEYVVVKCCAPSDLNTSPKYNNTNAAFIAVAYVTEARPINWTIATDDSADPVESEIKDTAFVELGPCPCDLTVNKCDVDCCCDGDCTEDDVELFTQCIPGSYGGQPGPDPDYLCSSKSHKKPDWFPFLCVQWSRTMYLGMFRQPLAAPRDEASYEDLRATAGDQFSFSDTTGRFNDTTPEATQPYVQGFAVKTGRRESERDSVETSNFFRLTLPQNTLNGQCIGAAPVRYLVDAQSSCTQTMRENLCGDFTRLSARIYAQSTGLWENQAAPQVLQENAQSIISFTDTNYFCLTDTESAEFIKKTITRKQVYPKDKPYYFDDMPLDYEDCDFDPQTGAYICGGLDFEGDNITTVSYTRCPWDDGFTQAPFPSFDNTSGNIDQCRDAVLSVVYNFTWQGSEIQRLDATVLLGNVPLQVEQNETVVITYVNGSNIETIEDTVTTLLPAELTQKFKAVWTHRLNANISADRENIDVSKRSGVVGYDFELPIFSGVDVRNDTTDEFLYVDTNASKSLSLWKPAQSGLCEGAGRESIDFGVNAQSSCMLRLGLSDLLDCEELRKTVLYQQDRLMISNYISEGGDPNRTNLATWIPVFREDLSGIITTPSNETTETTAFPDTTFEMEDENENVSMSYVDGLIGRCHNIPAHIHVDIMHAIIGKIDNRPVYNIIGAKISYGLRSWSMYCGGKDGEACTEQALGSLDSQVQTFTVSSSVAFIQVPSTTPESLTEYELRQQVNKSSSYVCEQNKCWEQLFYPLTPAYTGETRFYSLGFSLILVGLSIGYALVTRPFY